MPAREFGDVMRYLQQKAKRAEVSRVRYEQSRGENDRRAAEFDARMLIGAATDAVEQWASSRRLPAAELLRVFEVPVGTVRSIGLHGRLFSVFTDDLRAGWVRLDGERAGLHCHTHESTECECVRRVRASGLYDHDHTAAAAARG